eukprot:TRINITY_DN2184_c1_g5_i1.p1 TRINITY_DN2184_c1_g5~~TRINITY_DN2184_c1_g5_i1.p1  ORF type:complete len:509 (+),score=53.02 TRINITY_DN2184_c1_g5_i1:37-1563(+)
MEEQDVSAKSLLWSIVRLGWPGTIRETFAFIPGIAMLSFLGSDPDELAAGGMSLMFQNVTGICFIVSLGGGQSALASQAFGARNYVRCGEILQQQVGLHAVLSVFVCITWYFAEDILISFKQPADVARLVGTFLRIRMFAAPFFALREDLDNFLNAQQVMRLPMVISFVMNALNMLSFPLMISWFGFIGAPLAMTSTQIVHALILFALAKWTIPHAEAWPAWSPRIMFSNWGPLLKIGAPSAAMMVCEWLGWEINMLLAGLLCRGSASCADLDAFPILSNLMTLSWLLLFGFYCSAGVLVGNALGAGDPLKARKVSRTILTFVLAVATLTASASFIGRWHWAKLYTDDQDIITLTGKVMPVVSVYIFTSALGTGATLFVVRSAGRVVFPAITTAVSFYVIGIPAGIYLTFFRFWGVHGIWTGLTIGMTCTMAVNVTYMLFVIDWQQASMDAQAGASSACQSSKDQRVPSRSIGKHSRSYGRMPEIDTDLHVSGDEASFEIDTEQAAKI